MSLSQRFAGLFLALSLLAAIPVMAAPPLSSDAVRDELIVAWAAAGRPSAARLAAAGLQPLRELPLGLSVVGVMAGASEVATAAQLEGSGLAAWAEPNYIFTPDFTPDDPYYSNQQPYLNRLEAAAAWDIQQGTASVVVAVLDTGVDITHEDLQGVIWTNAGEMPGNGIDDDGNGFVDDVHGWDFAADENTLTDDYGHGTHVAGIIGATLSNGKGIAGLAGGVTLMPVDVFSFGIGTYEDLIRAIVYATDNGANVINMSLGASSYSRGEEMAVNYATAHGVVVAAAAGNRGRDAYHYPAAHENAIAVTSTTSSDTISSFSNRGTWVDVAAPGSSIWSLAPGSASYVTKSGTSMATPHVAALAALLLSRDPTLTPQQVRQRIESTADDLGATGFDIQFGHGRINARRALEQTPPAVGGPRSPLPPLDLTLFRCQELLVNGGFEIGLAAWQSTGAVAENTQHVHAGARSAVFAGAPNASGVLKQIVRLPPAPQTGVIRFKYRIATADGGYGTDPARPFEDWLTVELRTPAGARLVSLLATGNTADTSGAGLEWDEYLYRLENDTLAAIAAEGSATLVFTAQSDADSALTSFWLDEVSVCVEGVWAQRFPVLRSDLPLH